MMKGIALLWRIYRGPGFCAAANEFTLAGWRNTMKNWSNKRVMVVDDSQTMRMLLLFHVIKLLPGVKIMEAVNGSHALEKLKQQDVDLILTDMNMPELDGAGLICAVRLELKRQTPIIVITTKGEQRDRERGMELGANGYITKPLDIRQFRSTVLKFLS